MYFWSADQHFFHKNIIKYENRPFSSIEEMHNTIIHNHNLVVKKGDKVIHVGDFSFGNREETEDIIRQLEGEHTFLLGNHDYWLKGKGLHLWEKSIEGLYITAMHYAMRVWPRSHYNSIQLHGHSHGKLSPIGKQIDVGVDANNFMPVSFEEVKERMSKLPDNPGYVALQNKLNAAKQKE